MACTSGKGPDPYLWFLDAPPPPPPSLRLQPPLCTPFYTPAYRVGHEACHPGRAANALRRRQPQSRRPLRGRRCREARGRLSAAAGPSPGRCGLRGECGGLEGDEEVNFGHQLVGDLE